MLQPALRFATAHHRHRRFKDDSAAPACTSLLQALYVMLQYASRFATTTPDFSYNASPASIFCHNHTRFLVQPAICFATTHHGHRFFATTGVAISYYAPPAAEKKLCPASLFFDGTGGDFLLGPAEFLAGTVMAAHLFAGTVELHQRRTGGLRRRVYSMLQPATARATTAWFDA